MGSDDNAYPLPVWAIDWRDYNHWYPSAVPGGIRINRIALRLSQCAVGTACICAQTRSSSGEWLWVTLPGPMRSETEIHRAVWRKGISGVDAMENTCIGRGQ